MVQLYTASFLHGFNNGSPVLLDCIINSKFPILMAQIIFPWPRLQKGRKIPVASCKISIF